MYFDYLYITHFTQVNTFKLSYLEYPHFNNIIHDTNKITLIAYYPNI